jgi:hypothetical protein
MPRERNTASLNFNLITLAKTPLADFFNLSETSPSNNVSRFRQRTEVCIGITGKPKHAPNPNCQNFNILPTV